MFCPSCGKNLAETERFRAMTVCPACRAAVVLDAGATRVAGTMALLTQTPSPLQVGGVGSLMGRTFQVAGRVRYGYRDGAWDEWFLFFDDGSQAWISEDGGELTFESFVRTTPPMAWEDAQPGATYQLGDESFVVAEKAVAICEGAEGDLPFPVLPEEKVPFLDLEAPEAMATVEYELDGSVIVFRGRHLTAGELDMQTAPAVAGEVGGGFAGDDERRERVVKDTGKAQELRCYGCGAPLPAPGPDDQELTCAHCGSTLDLTQRHVACADCGVTIPVRGGEATHALACPKCHSQLDVSRDEARLLARSAQQQTRGMTFELGTPCTLEGVAYVVAGYLRSRDQKDGSISHDYMLYNAERGFRWLGSESGHWTLYSVTRERPSVDLRSGAARQGRKVTCDGRTYTMYWRGTTKVMCVLGELPWVAKVDDVSHYLDAGCDGHLLSAEWTDQEYELYHGRYLPREEVAKAFGVPVGKLPRPRGVACHQPLKGGIFLRQTGVIAAVAALVMLVLTIGSCGKGDKIDTLSPISDDGPNGYVGTPAASEPFDVTGSDTICMVEAFAPCNDDTWTYAEVALIDAEDRALLDFSVEMSYYSGYSGGESWTENNRTDKAVFKIAEPGTYRLLAFAPDQIRRERDCSPRPIRFTVYQDVTLTRWYLLALVLALAWVGLTIFIIKSHEQKKLA
ncbi:MAG: DUF4178 domain-containing protein [Planctomycetota bacterium]